MMSGDWQRFYCRFHREPVGDWTPVEAPDFEDAGATFAAQHWTGGDDDWTVQVKGYGLVDVEVAVTTTWDQREREDVCPLCFEELDGDDDFETTNHDDVEIWICGSCAKK